MITVEVAGIEPASFDFISGLLRAQPAVLFSAPAVTQASCRRAQPLFVFPSSPATGVLGGASWRRQVPGRRRPRADGLRVLRLPRQRERSQRGLNWRLLVSRSWFTRSSLGSSARFPCHDDRSRNRSPPVELSVQDTPTWALAAARCLGCFAAQVGGPDPGRYSPRPRRATARSASRLACCSARA